MTFVLKSIREFSTPLTNAEQKTGLRPTTGLPYNYYPVIVCPIGDVIAGDVVEVNSAYCQVTTEMRYNLMVSSSVILADAHLTARYIGKDDWGHYPEIAKAVGFNIDRNMHHYPVQRTGRFTVTEDMANAHVILMVWTASTAYVAPTMLEVDPNRGRIEGAVHRAVTAADLQALIGASVPAPAPETSPEDIPILVSQAQATALQQLAAAVSD